MKAILILSLALVLSIIPELFALIILFDMIMSQQHYNESFLEREKEQKSDTIKIMLAHYF